MKPSIEKKLLGLYQVLLDNLGHQGWWPADSPFEVMIGAILTQNVSWNNVKKAINNLKEKSILEQKRLLEIDLAELAPLIRSTRYYNEKAKKIKNFLNFYFDEYNGDLETMSKEETMVLRKKLLKINGLGEETVDSILLYACDKPIFVVDAYTKRIFSRYGLIDTDANYLCIQKLFMENLPCDIELYNDFHAQIVHLGNAICKTKPECNKCPIREVNRTIKCQYYLKNKEYF